MENLLRWQVTILWSHWCSLFQTSVDSAQGFWSQGRWIIACAFFSLFLRVNSGQDKASWTSNLLHAEWQCYHCTMPTGRLEMEKLFQWYADGNTIIFFYWNCSTKNIVSSALNLAVNLNLVLSLLNNQILDSRQFSYLDGRNGYYWCPISYHNNHLYDALP